MRNVRCLSDCQMDERNYDEPKRMLLKSFVRKNTTETQKITDQNNKFVSRLEQISLRDVSPQDYYRGILLGTIRSTKKP